MQGGLSGDINVQGFVGLAVKGKFRKPATDQGGKPFLRSAGESVLTLANRIAAGLKLMNPSLHTL